MRTCRHGAKAAPRRAAAILADPDPEGPDRQHACGILFANLFGRGASNDGLRKTPATTSTTGLSRRNRSTHNFVIVLAEATIASTHAPAETQGL